MAAATVMTLLGTAGTSAHARIHRHVDPETGITTYRNYPSSTQRREKRVALPAPQEVSVSPRTLPPVEEPTPIKRVSTNTRLVPATYNGFPRVSAEIQRERDSERRRILKEELVWEQTKLDQAIENKSASDVVQRYKGNIEALHREISNTR